MSVTCDWLHLCDKVFPTPPGTGNRPCVLGIYDHIRFASMPFEFAGFVLAAFLRAPEGTSVDVSARMAHEKGGVVGASTTRAEFVSRGGSVVAQWHFGTIVFPEIGRYDVSVIVEGAEVARTTLQVLSK